MIARLVVAFVVVSSGCGGHECPRTPKQTTLSDLLIPVDLEIRVFASISQCERPSRPIEIELDGKPVGAVSIPCDAVLDVVQAPPPAYHLTIPQVPPGMHNLRARDPQATRDHAYDVILPAIEASSDGTSAFIGGNVEIWVMDDGIRIDDPTPIAVGHV